MTMAGLSINSRHEERLALGCLVCLTLIAGSAALYWLEPVLVPLVLAVLLSQALTPIVVFAERRGLPHSFAVVCALVVGLSALLLLLVVVSLAAHDIVGKAKQYESYVIALSNKAAAAHRSATAQLASSRIASKVMERQGELLGNPIGDLSIGSFVVGVTQGLLASFANWLSNSLLVIVFVIYLLEGQRKQRGPRRGMLGRIEGRIQRYMSIKVGISVFNGLMAWALYRLLRVDLAIVFGVLHFVLNFIPSVGPLVATVVPLPVVLVAPSTTAMDVLLVLGLPLVSHGIIGHVLEPKLMGQSLELHPIAVLASLIFWSMIWGLPGMLLATPITAAAKLVFESMDITLPLAQLLAGELEDASALDPELGALATPRGGAGGPLHGRGGGGDDGGGGGGVALLGMGGKDGGDDGGGGGGLMAGAAAGGAAALSSLVRSAGSAVGPLGRAKGAMD